MKKTKKMSYRESGKLGAIALNADPEKKAIAAKKAAATRKALDPDCFKKMGAIRKKKTKPE